MKIYFAVVSSIQGLFHKIQALHLQIQGVFKDQAVFQGVFQARANHACTRMYTQTSLMSGGNLAGVDGDVTEQKFIWRIAKSILKYN